MGLSEVCVKRPVFTCMLIALPTVMGVISYNKLGVDLFPNVDLPIVTVTTTRKGAGVEEMESGVTKQLEEILNTVSGIDEMNSTTKEGISIIVVTFHLEKNREVAAQEVRDKINTILARLPAGTDAPVIDKFDMDSAPVMAIAVSGRRDLREITELADKRIREPLQTIDGVGAIILTGGRKRAINITVDNDLLQGFGLSIEQVRMALGRQNLEIPGGRVDQRTRELTLRTMGRIEDTRDFNELIIANVNGRPVRVSDIGRAEDSFEETRSLVRLDGDNAVNLIVQKQSGYNTVAVIDAVNARLKALSETLPEDIKTLVVRDQSRFINGSIDEVRKHLLLGALLVSATILLFIRDWRTTLIAAVSIPASLVGTFVLMEVMGFTLNTITMLALVMAVGVVIDDAVVVHENIFRHMEELGKDARTASIDGTKEIALAVMATTFSLLVIFLPLAFMHGRVGKFFSTFGFVMAFAVALSLIVSFTLTPMLCSRFLKLSDHEKERLAKGLPPDTKAGLVWRMVEGSYMWFLRISMRHRWVVVLLSLGCLYATFPLYKMAGKDFLPRDDQSEFEITFTAPEGWTMDRTDRVCKEIEALVEPWKKTDSVRNMLTTIGDTSGRVSKGEGDVTTASIYIRMDELDEREISQFELMRRARAIMSKYPDLRSSVNLPSLVNTGRLNADIQFNLMGPDLRKLDEYSRAFLDKMRSAPGLVDADTTLALRKPELRVIVDRDKASDRKVDVNHIASTLSFLVGGQIVSDFKDESVGELYDVWLRAEGFNRNDARAVWDLTVPNLDGKLVQLASVTKLTESRGPSQIDRFNRQRKVTVYCNLDGLDTQTAVAQITELQAQLGMSSEYSVTFAGRAKLLEEAWVNFAMAFGLSAVFMYMILAAQFESFVQPITILLAAPLTIPFAILSLILLDQALDVYATLGLFLLFGIVKKNGILQVDYTNHLREHGMEREKAILVANSTRLRPILMTTVMLVAGMVPMALGTGPGAARRASVAKVIVGGQMLSLLLTLLITPVSYSMFDDIQIWLGKRRKRGLKDDPHGTPGSGHAGAEAGATAHEGNGSVAEPLRVEPIPALPADDGSAPTNAIDRPPT